MSSLRSPLAKDDNLANLAKDYSLVIIVCFRYSAWLSGHGCWEPATPEVRYPTFICNPYTLHLHSSFIQ